jgi:hypothetical protein
MASGPTQRAACEKKSAVSGDCAGVRRTGRLAFLLIAFIIYHFSLVIFHFSLGLGDSLRGTHQAERQ